MKEEADWPLSFYTHFLEEAMLGRNDIYKVFREYENERLLVPVMTRSFEYKKYCAGLWTLQTMKDILLDAYDRGGAGAVIMHCERFCKMLDICCCANYESEEIKCLFAVCYDTAMDISQYFMV